MVAVRGSFDVAFSMTLERAAQLYLFGSLRAGVAALLVLATDLGAQTPARGSNPAATREQVLAEAQRLEAFSASTAYGPRLRRRAADEAANLRRRLESGDFRTGDRIFVRVSGSATFADTVVVDDSTAVFIGSFGSVSLASALRSEAPTRVKDRARATARDAEVVVQPLLRVAVFGPVAAPGYLHSPMDARLDDVLSRAGGPLQTADPMRMRVVRGGVEQLSSVAVRAAIVSGRTLADLGIRDGDFLVLEPARAPWDRTSTFQIAGLIVGPLLTAALLR